MLHPSQPTLTPADHRPAPTMIDALRELVIAAEAAGWDTDVLNAPILDDARAALAKAEGR